MSRAGIQNRGTKEHPQPFLHVIDFRKKLWLLFLLHEAMHNDHQRHFSHSADKEVSLFAAESQTKPMEWFATGMLASGYATRLWPEDQNRPAMVGDPDTFVVTYQTLFAVYDTTWPRMRSNPDALFAAIQHSHVNRRFGFHLDAAGRWSADNASRMKPHFLQHLFPEEDKVSQRILYRLVRGFFMLPTSMIRLSDDSSPVSAADGWLPTKVNCWGDDTKYLAGLSPPAGDLVAKQDWLDLQRRSVDVFRTFCGRPASQRDLSDRDLVGSALGSSFEAFRAAVEAYYLAPYPELNLCSPPPFFERHEPARDKTETLAKQVYEVEGTGRSAFNAMLGGVYTVETGRFDVYGSFGPPASDPAVNFSCLEVHLGREVEGAVTRGLTRSESKALPPGCRDYQSDTQVSYFVRLTAQDGSELDQMLRNGFQVMTVALGGKPFDVSYWVYAPTASNWPAKTRGEPGRNSETTTASEVVVGYLRSLLAPTQTDWTPPDLIPIIETGTLTIADPQKERPK